MPSPLAIALANRQPFVAPPQTNVAPTDVAQIYKNAQDATAHTYKAELERQAAMWGNLATLGRAGITAFGGPIAGMLFPPRRTPAPVEPVDY
jgi:hypothetical protein